MSLDIIEHFRRLPDKTQFLVAQHFGLTHPNDYSTVGANQWLLRAREKGVLEAMGKFIQETAKNTEQVGITITVEKEDGKYIAYINGQKDRCGTGANVKEAVGDVILFLCTLKQMPRIDWKC